MTLSHFQLLELDAEASFTYDSNGRMIAANEADYAPAPRFFLARSAEGDLWRVRHDVPDDLVPRLAQLVSLEPPATDLRRPPACLAAIRALLETQAPVERVDAGPGYYFPGPVTPPPQVRLLADADAELLRPFFEGGVEAPPEILHMTQPWAVVLEDGGAVAFCFSARLTARAASAGLETLEGYRWRGHGTAVVAGWAAAVQRSGRVPLYGTSWDNVASQGVARKLGLVCFCGGFSIT